MLRGLLEWSESRAGYDETPDAVALIDTDATGEMNVGNGLVWADVMFKPPQ